MKVINLNENQYRRLFEIADYSSNEQDNMPGGIGSKTVITAIKTSKDGDKEEFGIDPDSEKIASMLSPNDRKTRRGAI